MEHILNILDWLLYILFAINILYLLVYSLASRRRDLPLPPPAKEHKRFAILIPAYREYMQEHHPACRIWELDLHAKRDSEDTLMLDEFFQEHPTVKNGITFNSKAYIIGEYLLKKQKKDFNLMGYDLLQRNVDCLKQGSIFFLIAQQPTLQGFDGIKALCEYLILKKEITRENFMPIDLLTKENIEFYYNK